MILWRKNPASIAVSQPRDTAGSLLNHSEQLFHASPPWPPLGGRWFQLKYLSLNVVKPAFSGQEMPAIGARCRREQQRAAVCLSPSDKLFLEHF